MRYSVELLCPDAFRLLSFHFRGWFFRQFQLRWWSLSLYCLSLVLLFDLDCLKYCIKVFLGGCTGHAECLSVIANGRWRTREVFLWALWPYHVCETFSSAECRCLLVLFLGRVRVSWLSACKWWFYFDDFEMMFDIILNILDWTLLRQSCC